MRKIQRERQKEKERDKETEVKIDAERQRQRGKKNRDKATRSFGKGQREGLYYSLAYKVCLPPPTHNPLPSPLPLLSLPRSSAKFLNRSYVLGQES